MPTFDEAFYLASNPDVAAAVARGQFSSGLEHFQLFGQAEGRLGVPPATGGSALSIGPIDFENFSDGDLLGNVTLPGNGFSVTFSENVQVLTSSQFEGGNGNFRSGPDIGRNVIASYQENDITLNIQPAPGVTFTSGELSFLYSSPNVDHELEIEDGAGVELLRVTLPRTPGPGDGSDDFNPFSFFTVNFTGDVREIELGSTKTELGLDNIQLSLQSTTTPPPPQQLVVNDDFATIIVSRSATINVVGNDSPSLLAVIGFSPLTNSTGTLVNNGDGTFNYTANPTLGNATDSFTYTVVDSSGRRDSATVTITAINNDPEALDDAVETIAGTAVDIDVLANDLDNPGDSVILADFPSTTDNGGAIALSDNGTPDDPTDDFLTYTPADGFTGTDSFTYSITDGRDGTSTATVTVTVNPGFGSLSGTVFQDDNGNGVQEDDEDVLSGVTVFLDTNNDGELDSDEESLVTDADGNYSFTDLEPSIYIVREVVPDGFTQTFPGGSGGLVGDGFADVVLEYFDSGAGPIAGPYGQTATGDAPEAVSLDVVLGDEPSEGVDFLSLPTGSSVTVGFTDEAVIDGPGDDIFIRELDPAGEQAEVFVSSNFTDFTLLGIADDGVTTSFDLADIGFTERVQAVRIVGLDDLGASPGFDVVNVQVLPESIGSGTGAHVVALDAGEDIEDLDFGNAQNQSPIAVDDVGVTTDAGTAVSIDVLSNDSDPEGNPVLLTFFTTVTANGGTVSRDDNNTPDDLSDDLLIYTPADNFSGVDSFSYTISDGLGGSATSTVSVTVVGDAQPLNLTGEWQYSSPEDFSFVSGTGFFDDGAAFAAPFNIIQNGNQITITAFYQNSVGSGTGVISGDTITATIPVVGGTGELVGTISANGRIITGTITFSDGEPGNSIAIIDFTMFGQLDGGNDIIIGDAGDNILTADFGDDFIRSLAGNDQLDGGAGNDTLDSGAGTIAVTSELDFTVSELLVGDGPIDLVAVNFSIEVLGVQVEDLFIITANSGSSDLSLLQSNGDGTFTSLDLPLAFPDGVTVSSLRSADEDGDGNADFLVGTDIENNTVVGVRTTLETFEFAVGDNPVSVVLGDLNGDGNIDGATANSGDDTVTILTNINNEDATSFNIEVGTTPVYITAADIDGDSDLDLIVVNSGSNSILVLGNDGAGNFQITSEIAVGNSPVWVTAADLDGDSDIDLAVVNSEDDSVTLLLNNGSGSFSESGTIQVGSNPVSITAADLDGDSDIDLAVVESDDNNISIWRNNGSASFSFSANVTVGSNPVSITAADLDADGDIDLAVANEGSDSVSVILNEGLVTVGGGDGGDTMTGGAGSDIFVLNLNGIDVITDFEVGVDVLLISQDIFGDEFALGTLDETLFVLGTAATTPDQRFIYDIDTGILFFDADGNGATVQVQLVILNVDIEISAANLLVVETVTVPNQSPVALEDSATTNQDSAVTIDVLANDFDLDGDPISLTGFEAVSGNGATITRDNNSTPIDLTDDRIVYSPAADFTGTDSFIYTISDGSRTDTGTVTVTVDSDGVPTSDLTVTASVSNSTPAVGEEIAYSIQVTGLTTASNIVLRSLLPAGLDLQYTTTNLGVYDPNSNIWRIPTLPAGRTATLEINVEVTAGVIGETLISEVEVISPSGVDNQGTVEITISGENSSPIAADDEASTALETPVTVDVLINDFDLDDDALEVTAVGDPENGEAEIVGSEVIYTPDPEFAGTDSFIYTISDGRGGTDTATVTVTVGTGNQDPTAVPDEAIASVNQTISIDVLANDFDLDEEAIGLAAFQGQTAAGGTVVRNENNTPGDIRDDFLEYTPAAGFTGTDSFAYRIRDLQGGTDTARVTVNVTGTQGNQPPIAEDDNVSGAVDTTIDIFVLDNDSDPEGTLLSIADVTATTSLGGNVSIVGDALVYTPAFGFAGTDSFSYTIADSFGLTASAQVTVQVTGTGQNQRPIAIDDFVNGTADTTIDIFVLDNDSDPDFDLLSITGVSETTFSGGTVSIAGNALAYTPGFGFAGTDSFSYTVTDSFGLTASATVTVNVTATGGGLNGSISGTTFNDANSNSIEDVGEQGLAGFTIFLDNNSNGFLDPGEISAVTGASGNYFFGDLPAGSYNVQEIPQSDFISTTSNPVIVVLFQGENRSGVDFGNISSGVPPIESDIIVGNDSASTNPGSSVAIAVLANDLDLEGDPLAIVGFDQFTFNGGVVSIDENGTPFDLTDDLLVYSPPGGFVGTDSFSYTVSDQKSSNIGTVTVTVLGSTVEDLIIIGSTSNDDLVAGAGNDNLTGDLGNDTLTGGAGSDVFIFNSPDEGTDLITDFNGFDGDAIGVSGTGFGGGLIEGNLDPIQFTLGVAASDPNHRFIYGSNDGSLFFDADGTGAIAPVQIATLSGAPTEFSALNIIVL